MVFVLFENGYMVLGLTVDSTGFCFETWRKKVLLLIVFSKLEGRSLLFFLKGFLLCYSFAWLISFLWLRFE